MWFPKSSLQSTTQLHSPTPEGAEISREKPRCCCTPLASPWIVPSTAGWVWGAQALHLRWLSCPAALWAGGQRCPRARISFSIAAGPAQSSLQSTQRHPDSSTGYGKGGPEPGCPCGPSWGASLLSQRCIPAQVTARSPWCPQPAWSQLSSTGLVPQALPHCCVHTNCHESYSWMWAEYKSSAIREIKTPGTWQTLLKGLCPHQLDADSLTFHR